MEKRDRGRRHTDSYWQNRIFKVCQCLAEMILGVEILYMIAALCGKANVGAGGMELFLIRCVVAPTIINFGGIFIVKQLLKSTKVSEHRKNQLVCYQAFLLTAVIQCTHYYFAEVLLLPCIAIIFSALFVDLKLCRNISVIACFTLSIASIERCAEGLQNGFEGIVAYLIGITAVVCTYQVSIILVQYEKVQYWLISRSRRRKNELLEQIKVEPTTGLLSRRVLMETIDRCCETENAAETMQLAMVDIDNFKKINDTYGHLCGDEVLHRIGRIIKSHVNGDAEGYRYGGEEFVIIFNKDNIEEAVSIMEKIRIEMAKTRFDFLEDGGITVSCGIAEYHKGMKPSEWLSKADDSLYQAKSEGKNRVIVNI
ncbi:MAG: GGDEF domain-containing protein [Lachnospiraceae bacterium]|nr:GGDEF domain-containing protein [Lachnospiraceae bacterium]